MMFINTSQGGQTIDRHGPAQLLKRGGLKSYYQFVELLGFDSERYLTVYETILRILRTTKPRVDVAVVDVLMPMGKDACTVSGVPWGVICPNSGLELAKHNQPSLRGFWKFPA